MYLHTKYKKELMDGVPVVCLMKPRVKFSSARPYGFGKEDIKKFHYINLFNPLPEDKILGWSNLKQIADDILKCI